MVKIAVLVGAVLSLSACTQENTTNTASAADITDQTQTLRIAAAANLSDVLPEIIAGYKKDNNLPAQTIHDIDVTYASSGKLYAQITAGAPYDIFLSANQAFPAKLADTSEQGVTFHKPFTYAQGQLALYSIMKPLNDLNPKALADILMGDTNSKITIANPKLAPYGASAKSYLQSQKIYDALEQQKRLIQAENIGQAFQYAHTGNVDYGFVAQSQLVAINAKPEQFITLEPASYPAILQDGIIISDSAMATDFRNYLLSTAGQQHFLQAGYLTAQ
ncbi:molybdate ABC transporter substrate-binding protein [uncultured Psychrobacter sp.]|uniref:molybdate ABC transporter substrate-binding protein n=1 Tax=uncultured Psychrobacter sp. TaxID=259303 RepID=UPI002623072D|nr:molybdate ABC transporter substrate-binding protein [uncultured Psychrobacter sp.]